MAEGGIETNNFIIYRVCHPSYFPRSSKMSKWYIWLLIDSWSLTALIRNSVFPHPSPYHWPSTAPLVEISFSSQPSAAIKIEDDGHNFCWENNEHSLAKITSAPQATVEIPKFVWRRLTCCFLCKHKDHEQQLMPSNFHTFFTIFSCKPRFAFAFVAALCVCALSAILAWM